MQLGAMVRGSTIEEIVDNVEGHRAAGYSSVWLTDGIGMDPLTVLATVGRAVPAIELGTAVVRTLPRHPMALAQQAMTTQALTGGRLTLGIGPSHRPAVEAGWGLSFDRPITRMRDYLSVLVPLLRDGAVSYDGPTTSAHGELRVAGGEGGQVLVGALGPQMLRLAGRMADGTVTFMTGPRTLAGFTAPTLIEAAERSGRPQPRIVAMIGLCVTDDTDGARRRAEEVAGRMAALPSYAGALAREGGPSLITGGEDDVEETLAGLERAGVTDVIPIPVARRDSDAALRTAEFLAARLGRSADRP